MGQELEFVNIRMRETTQGRTLDGMVPLRKDTVESVLLEDAKYLCRIEKAEPADDRAQKLAMPRGGPLSTQTAGGLIQTPEEVEASGKAKK